MNDFRAKFTKWYYRKGYRMSYRSGEYGIVAELIFHCPFWIRPLVEWFFSPSVYYREYGLDVGETIVAGMGG